ASAEHRHSLSFPTRRSSDLFRQLPPVGSNPIHRPRPHTNNFSSILRTPNMLYIQKSGRKKQQSTNPVSSRRRKSKKAANGQPSRSEEHTSELQSRENLVCRL